MPQAGQGGSWRGWWEGVVDLTLDSSGQRSFDLEKLFRKGVPRAFPEAEESVIRVIGEGFDVEPSAKETVQWVDGRAKRVSEWDLLRDAPSDVRVSWKEDRFEHREFRGESEKQERAGRWPFVPALLVPVPRRTSCLFADERQRPRSDLPISRSRVAS